MRASIREYISSAFLLALSFVNTSCDPSRVFEEQQLYFIDTEMGVVHVQYIIYKRDSQLSSPLLLHLDSDRIGLLRRGSKYFLIDSNGRRHELRQRGIVWYDVQKQTHRVLAAEWNYGLRLDKDEFSDYIIAVLTEAGIIVQ